MRRCIRLSLFALSMGLAQRATAEAQTPSQSVAQRAPIDSLLHRIATVHQLAELPAAASCTTVDSATAELCRAIIETAHADLSMLKPDGTRALASTEHFVDRYPADPVGWYVLAAARLAADEAGLKPHAGPLQHDHADNAGGAERALLHALTLDSTLVYAAEALATVPVVHDTTSRLVARVIALRRARHLLPAPFLLAAAIVEREAGHADSAMQLEGALLKNRAAPRGIVDLNFARDLFHTDHADLAQKVYYGGANDPDSLSVRAYRNELIYASTSAELAKFDSLKPADRPAWLQKFWTIRDLQSGRPDGARLAEQYHRMDEAFAMYRFRYVPAQHALPLPLQGYIDYFTTAIAGTQQPFRALRSWYDALDDRGLMYMRQGIPYLSMRTRSDSGYELWQYIRPGQPFYLTFTPRGFGPEQTGPWPATLLKKLADTNGFVAPAVLTATVASPSFGLFGYLQQDFCALKASLCHTFPDSSTFTMPRVNCVPAAPAANVPWRLGDPRYPMVDPNGTPLPLAAILRERMLPPPRDARYIAEREREEGLWTIGQAWAADYFGVPFLKSISASFSAHTLQFAPGDVRLVVAISIPPGFAAAPDVDLTQGGLIHSLRVHVAARSMRTGERFDIDTTLRLLTAPDAVTRKKESIRALLDLPLPPDSYASSIWIQQPRDESGVLVTLDSVSVPIPESGLHLSDLIIAGADSSLEWPTDHGSVRMHPEANFARGGEAELYLQASGLVPGKAYQAAFEFTKIAQDSTESAPFTLSSSYTPATAFAEIRRTVGMQSLSPGEYRVRAILTGNNSRGVANGCLVVDK